MFELLTDVSGEVLTDLQLRFKVLNFGVLSLFDETQRELDEREVGAHRSHHFAQKQTRRAQVVLLVEEEVLEDEGECLGGVLAVPSRLSSRLKFAP